MSFGLGSWGKAGWGLAFSSPLPADPAVPVVTVEPDVTSPMSATTPVVVSVTYAGSGISAIITAEFPLLGVSEVVWDGTSFGALYRNGNTKVEVITGGYRFTVLRTPKWPPTPLRMTVVPHIPV